MIDQQMCLAGQQWFGGSSTTIRSMDVLLHSKTWSAALSDGRSRQRWQWARRSARQSDHLHAHQRRQSERLSGSASPAQTGRRRTVRRRSKTGRRSTGRRWRRQRSSSQLMQHGHHQTGAAVRSVKKGATDRSVVIRIVDATDGTPETGVAYNTSGIDLWYRREGRHEDQHHRGVAQCAGTRTYRRRHPAHRRWLLPSRPAGCGGCIGCQWRGGGRHRDGHGRDRVLRAPARLRPARRGAARPVRAATDRRWHAAVAERRWHGPGQLASGGIGADDQHVGKLLVCRYSSPGTIRGSGLITDSVNSTDTMTLNGGARSISRRPVATPTP